MVSFGNCIHQARLVQMASRADQRYEGEQTGVHKIDLPHHPAVNTGGTRLHMISVHANGHQRCSGQWSETDPKISTHSRVGGIRGRQDDLI